MTAMSRSIQPAPCAWPGLRVLAPLLIAALLAGCDLLFSGDREVLVGVGSPTITPAEVTFAADADSSTPAQELVVDVGVNLKLAQRAPSGPSAVLAINLRGLPAGVEARVVEPVNLVNPQWGDDVYLFFSSSTETSRFRIELRPTSTAPLGSVSPGRHRVTVTASLGLTFVPEDPSSGSPPDTSARSESSFVIEIGGVAAAPAQPVDFTARPGLVQVALSWAADAAPTSYQLERAEADGTFAPLATVPAPATTYFDTGLAVATRYRYRLTPINDSGSGTPATLEVVTLAPAGNGTLALTLAGDGSGSVGSSPVGISCPAGACEMSAPTGTVVTLLAVPAPGSAFARWLGDDDCSDGVVTIASATACTARFADANAVVSRLSVSTSGNGSVSGSGSGIACPGDCDETFPRVPARNVTLTAVPAPLHTFIGWGGDCRGNATSVALVMDSSLACTASFAPLPEATLSVSLTGLGGHGVQSAPAGIDCPGSCTSTYARDQVLTLTLQGPADTRVSWSGSASGCSGSARSVTLTLGSASQDCTANVRPAPGPQAWLPLGDVVDTQVVGRPSLVIDASGIVTVAYLVDSGDRRQLRVRRFDGAGWPLVGNPAVNATGSSNSALSPALALRADGRPIVAWADQGGAVRVAAWDGAAWQSLADNLVIGGAGTFGSKPQLAIHGNTVVVAWMQFQGTQARLALMRHDLATGGAWVGGFVPGVSADADIAPQLALDAAGQATLLFVRISANSGELAPRAVEETASGWQPLCNDVAPGAGQNFANTSIGFGVHRGSDGIATAWVMAPNFSAVLGRRCEQGFWRDSDGGNGDGIALPVDNQLAPVLALATPAHAPQPTFAYILNTGYQFGSQIGTHTRRTGSDLWAFHTRPFVEPRVGPGSGLAAALASDGSPVVANLFDNGTGAFNELRVYRYFP